MACLTTAEYFSSDSCSDSSARLRSVISSQANKISPVSNWTEMKLMIFSVPSLQVAVNTRGIFSAGPKVATSSFQTETT